MSGSPVKTMNAVMIEGGKGPAEALHVLRAGGAGLPPVTPRELKHRPPPET